MKGFIAASLALSLVSADVRGPTFTPEAVRAHVAFLSDDLLEGRETGSKGNEIAARYVASRFEAAGLKPAGDAGGWYQTVTFQQTDRTMTPGVLTVEGAGAEKSWAHASDVLLNLNPREPKLDVSAPLVFAGYGIEDVRMGINDYRGLDVKGKIVVALRGFPKGMSSEIGAHLSATREIAAERRGAIGLVVVDTKQSIAALSWARRIHIYEQPGMNWIGTDGKVFVDAPGIRVGAALHTPVAEVVFAGAKRGLAAILEEADKTGGRPKGFALRTSIRIQTDGTAKRITSPNVAAILPGADPALASEYVVLSAHLDHIGVDPLKDDGAPEGDRINNGALDNAAGIAVLLEVARAAAAAPSRPRRSILFLASTAEEKGLLGADYFARHPSVPIGKIVGNVDLDMPLLLYPFTDVIAFGADHSTLGPMVAAAVAPLGIALSPDPMPEQSIFVRSDHYMFVKQGVPAVFLATGYANGGEKAWREFLAGNYHHGGDDMSQKIDWSAGARFVEANYLIMRAMADADTLPTWYQGDFFGDVFASERPKAAKLGH